MPYREAGEISCWIFVYDGHLLHPSARWSRAKGTFNAGHRFFVTFNERFDAAVVEVHYPPGDAFTHRGIAREPAKTDTLHASADDETACDAHLGMQIITPVSG
jgi:hypothetical protein